MNIEFVDFNGIYSNKSLLEKLYYVTGDAEDSFYFTEFKYDVNRTGISEENGMKRVITAKEYILKQIDQFSRMKLVTWIRCLCIKFNFGNDCFFNSIRIIDEYFLKTRIIDKSKFKIIALASLTLSIEDPSINHIINKGNIENYIKICETQINIHELAKIKYEIQKIIEPSRETSICCYINSYLKRLKFRTYDIIQSFDYLLMFSMIELDIALKTPPFIASVILGLGLILFEPNINLEFTLESATDYDFQALNDYISKLCSTIEKKKPKDDSLNLFLIYYDEEQNGRIHSKIINKINNKK